MIRPLRRRHLWLIALVGAVAGPIYLAALAARPDPPVQQTVPPALAEVAASPTGDGVELSTEPPIRVRPGGGGALIVEADGFVEAAGPLLYWTPSESSRSLADAHLLGALRGGERQVFELPAAAAGADGVLVLYSLGHGEEIAYAPWPARTEAAP